jgi:cytochrome P450
VLDREAAAFFLRSKAVTFPGMKVAEAFGITDGPLYEEMRRNIIHINGADHRRLRNLVNPAFTPRAADRQRPAMRAHVEALLEPLEAGGECEFVEAVAKPYPSRVIATVLGAPVADAPRLGDWSHWAQRQFDVISVMHDRERIERACVELVAYLEELLAARLDDPGDDLISTLLAAESEGDRLSHDECVHLVLNVLIGGVDTTQSQLAQAVRLLALHPEQWAALRADPELVAAAADEAIRYEPITPFTARMTLEDVEYRGVTFPEGTLLMVSAWHANRDSEDVERAEDFDIAADRGSTKPFTFGAGIHYCLGANLARAEMQEGLAALAEHFERIEPAGEPDFDNVQGIYGLNALPLRLVPA